MTRPRRQALLSVVAAVTDVPAKQLIGLEASRRIAGARHVGMAVAYRTGYTLKECAALFGRQDHATVIYALKRVAASQEATAAVDQVLTALGWRTAV